jgi:alcohol dehydrogenase
LSVRRCIDDIDLQKSMKTQRSDARALAAIFSGHGQPFRLEEFSIPQPGRGELLVDIACSTICGSDLHTWHGRRMEPTPCILGHEIVGRIAAFGVDAPRTDLTGQSLQEGDRITWTIAASCGGCFFCKRGLPQKCEHLFKYGHNAIAPGKEFSGGFAECCILTAGTGIVKLPDALSDSLAAPANCAVSTVAAAMRLAENLEGATVAVLGCGVLGVNAIAMARYMGAERVIACDLSADRNVVAKRFGATDFATPSELRSMLDEHTNGRGADISLEFSGAAAAVAGAIAATRTGGVAVIAGTTTPGAHLQLDANDLVRRMLTIRGLHNYGPQDLVMAVDFLSATVDSVPYDDLSGGSFALDDIENAFAASSELPGRRVAVIP